MSALNFPSSPSNGDTYQDYVYDSTLGVWQRNAEFDRTNFTVSATQPSEAENGDVWLDSNTGLTYLYYVDVDSSQWIEFGRTVVGPQGPPGPQGIQGPAALQKFAFVGERGGGSLVVNNNYAFGNGVTNSEIPMSANGSIDKMSIFLASGSTGSITVELVKNGISQGTPYQMIKEGSGVKTSTFLTPLSFEMGDSINVKIAAVSGTLLASTMQIFGTWF